MLGIKDRSDRRFGELLGGRTVEGEAGPGVEAGDFLQDQMKREVGEASEEKVPAFFEKKFEQVGRELRKLHEAGIIHLRFHAGNYSSESGGVVIHDLDSSKRSDQFGETQRFLYRLVDLGEAAKGVHEMLYHNSTGIVLQQQGVNPYAHLFIGYFGREEFDRDAGLKRTADELFKLTAVEKIRERTVGRPGPHWAHQRFAASMMAMAGAHSALEAQWKQAGSAPPVTTDEMLRKLDKYAKKVYEFQSRQTPEGSSRWRKLLSIFRR